MLCFIQPADIEKIEQTVDEALAQAAENLAQLEHIHEVKDDCRHYLVPNRKNVEFFHIRMKKEKNLETIL